MEEDVERKELALGDMFLVDEQGAKELEAAEKKLLARMKEIQAESEKRSAESGEDTKPYLVGLFKRLDRQNPN